MEDNVDKSLLERFEQNIWSKVPHLESGKVVNPTPLKDITEDIIECAKNVYNINLSGSELQVFGKYDSSLLTGSIKVRPAVHIVHEAIVTGRLRSGQTVIEATSGNFGIALGLLSNLGLTVVTLVSRRLQEGVFKELRNENIRIMDLDMDICPAPGMKDNPNVLAAKATAANVRSQLSQMGFNPEIFDGEITEIESLLAKQDIINLAKFLSKIYDCFCPQQYDNKLNIEVHKTVTAAEIDQQLSETGNSLKDFEVVCTFGTGGTSGGISRYVSEKYSKKSVHIVFPPAGQDVAGIRTKANANGLTYYTPEIYAGQHEVDFEQAKPLLKYFVGKGYDIGESSALALYAIMQMANFGGGGKFVAIIADGIAKYKKNFEAMSKQKRTRVSLEEASASTDEYDKVFWIHTQYTPKEEGLEVIAKSLGIDKSKIVVPKARTVNELLSTQKIPEELKKALEGSGKSLLVCMAGNTSLMAANVLGANGISAESLNGGITDLPDARTKPIPDLIQIARE
ncbi:MAG: pyridoxal-phosphate dependent enzyme [Nitrosarchaeum sp.]|nr:pyridoxal-phosphate dependent enzyme [Nitrosarchaeum sp.]